MAQTWSRKKSLSTIHNNLTSKPNLNMKRLQTMKIISEEKELRSFFLLGWHFKWIIKDNLLINVIVFYSYFYEFLPWENISLSSKKRWWFFMRHFIGENEKQMCLSNKLSWLIRLLSEHQHQHVFVTATNDRMNERVSEWNINLLSDDISIQSAANLFDFFSRLMHGWLGNITQICVHLSDKHITPLLELSWVIDSEKRTFSLSWAL